MVPRTGLPARRGLLTVVPVLEADDVVLPEVGAGLDLDQIERLVGRILPPVLGAERDIRRFVLADLVDRLAAGDARLARHDDPVLGALVAHMHRQRLLRLYHSPLSLPTPPDVHALENAP